MPRHGQGGTGRKRRDQGLSAGRASAPRGPTGTAPPALHRPADTASHLFSRITQKSKLIAQKANFKVHVLRDAHSARVGFALARGAESGLQEAAAAHVTADHLCWSMKKLCSL